MRYGSEKPIAGAMMAYSGRAIMAKTKEPGIAANVYFVQTLTVSDRVTTETHSEIKAALPRTVRRTARYSVVPHTHRPESRPSLALRSPQKTNSENKNRT